MSGTQKASGRYEFLDLYRTLVILFMFQGHVFREFLADTYLDDGWFMVHEVLHGVTAPAFLFSAGMAFVIASHRHRESYLRWSDRLEGRTRRIVMIFLLGIFLHLPYFSFRKMAVDASAHELLALLQSDVLTCVAVCLFLLHLTLLLARSDKAFYVVSAVMMFGFALLTPVVWEHDFLPDLPMLVAQFMNASHGSPFPLFPFAAYLFAGVLVALHLVRAAEKGEIGRFMRRLALWGLAVAAAGLILAAVPWSIYARDDFWYTGPAYFYIRTGILMSGVSATWKAAGLLRGGLREILVLGRESLFIYVLHLMALYGAVINGPVSMRALVPADQSLAVTIGLAAGLTVIMFFSAKAWHAMKHRLPWTYRALQFGTTGIVLYLFFTIDH